MADEACGIAAALAGMFVVQLTMYYHSEFLRMPSGSRSVGLTPKRWDVWRYQALLGRSVDGMERSSRQDPGSSLCDYKAPRGRSPAILLLSKKNPHLRPTSSISLSLSFFPFPLCNNPTPLAGLDL